MIWQLIIAGFIAALSAFIHTVFGERTNIKHLYASNVPKNEKLELRGVWHGFGVLMALTALVLFLSGITEIVEQPRTIVHAIAIVYSAIGLVFFWVVLRGGVRQVLQVPGWALLLSIAAFAWWGGASLG